VAGRDVGSVVEDLSQQVEEVVDVPAVYFVEYGGRFESAAGASRTVSLMSLLSVAAVFLLLWSSSIPSDSLSS